MNDDDHDFWGCLLFIYYTSPTLNYQMRIYVFCIYVCAHIVPRPDDDDGEQEEEEEEDDEEEDDDELSCNMS